MTRRNVIRLDRERLRRGLQRRALERRPPARGWGTARRRRSGRHRAASSGSLLLCMVLLAGGAGWHFFRTLPASGGACVEAQITSCYDGDTCRAWLDGGEVRVRLVGFDTPELGNGARCAGEQQLALRARERLRQLVAAADERRLCPQGYDRYDRLLARLLLDGRDVAATMIGEGLARPYAGGARAGWCG